MKHLVNIENETYSLWINDTPEYYLKKLKEGYFTLEGSKTLGFLSKDLYLSDNNIKKISRKPFSTYIHNFKIFDDQLITRVNFEIDLDEGYSYEDLEYYNESDDFESSGSCDNCFYFNKINKETILENTDRYIQTDFSFYLKFISSDNRKILIKTVKSYYDELKEDIELTKKIKEVWNEN